MRLKSINIQGFKSFADKTVIRFDKDITGIVGPNGCGKSNVIDSIRWVLGEQKTRALRSDKMDNLIFNGTKNRKNAHRAQVELTLENDRDLLPTEFSTVTITRILYRTGDSEYRINNVACRLKDITGLFMDTGISSNSYAIIELGMISEILNDKDNTRRRMFEQASGISKYKVRKRETINKLNLTEADIERVEDLLAEIESNLKTLEKQAKKATRFNKIKGEYKELSIELALIKTVSHKERYARIEEQKTQEAERKGNLAETMEQAEQELVANKEKLIQEEGSLNESKEKLTAHIDDLRFKENKKGLLNEKVKFLREKKAGLQNRVKQDEESIVRLKEEIKNLEQSIKDEKGTLQEILKRLEVAKVSNSDIRNKFAQHKGELQELEQDYRELEHAVFKMEKDVAIKTSQRENLLSEISDNRIKFESREDELKTFKTEREKVVTEHKTNENKLQNLIDEEESILECIAEKEGAIEEIRENLIASNRELDSKKNEFQLIKSLRDQLEGYSEASKYLSTIEGWAKDVMMVADIINCDDAYKIAIENYLQPSLEHYVVRDVEQALGAIDLLKLSEKGKANFFLLSEINAKEVATPNIDGLVKAVDVLKVKARFKNLGQHLLHNVYIAQDDWQNVDISKNPEAIILTQNGEIIKQDGEISGGSVGAYEGKTIGQIQNLESLEEEITALSQKVEELQEETHNERDVLSELRSSTKDQQIHNTRQFINKLESKIAAFDARIQNYELIIEESSTKSSGLQERIKELGEEIEGNQAAFTQLQAEKDEQAQKTSEFREWFLDIENEMNDSSEAFNTLNIEFHRQQNTLNTFQQNMSFKQNQIEDLEGKIESNKQLWEESEQGENDIMSSLSNSDGELKELYETKELLQAEYTEKEKAYFQLRGTIEQSETNLREGIQKQSQVEQLLGQLREQHNQMQMEMVSVKERLSIEFGIEWEELMQQEASGEYELDDLNEKVAKLKGRIERFGEVNPFAETAYNEMKERYDFICEQRDDLLTAKEALMTTIKEIEDTATDKFMGAFNQVRENFMSVFKDLFSQDDICDLKLKDPDDPLESKIEIIAQPKGKRPLTINQLSGGEKSLTAISLIFGLYLLKPAPFCILDEVDAPLDDANVDKFNNVIRRFSENSQFIVITHNKMTMSTVDIIYGVTMAEAGISRVVPVDFSSLN